MAAAIALRRTGLATAIVALLGWLLLLAAPPAAAHAVLESSTPRNGQLVAPGTAVLRVALRFDEPVEGALGALQVIAPSGDRVDTGGVRHPGGAGNQVEVGLRPGRLGDGTYLVVWRVISADSHPVHGSFSFSVGRSGRVAEASAANAADSSLGVALGLTRFAGYVGLLLLVGLARYFILCLPAGWTNPTGRRLLHGALAVACVATVAGLALQAAYDLGGGWTRGLDPRNVRTLIGTRLGHAHVLRLDLLLTVTLMLRRPVKPGRARQALVVAALLAALTTVAVEGHGGASALAAALDVAHLGAAGLWFGGLVVLAALDLPARRRAAVRDRPAPAPPAPAGSLAVLERVVVQPVEWTSVRRFSRVALCSVAVLLATGVIQALRQIPGIAALTGTRYRQLLLVKIAIIALVLAAATLSRATLRSHASGDGRRVRVLTRSVVAETLLLTLTLAVTSVLVASTPARVAYRPAQERTVHAGRSRSG